MGNRELAKSLLDMVQIILDTVAIDGMDTVYKMLMECHEGVYDYLGAPHNKNVMPLPDYKPPLFVKNFGSIIFSERLFHPYMTETMRYKSAQLILMEDRLLSLNEKIRIKSNENRSKHIFVWYLNKISGWLAKILPPIESHSVHTVHNDLHWNDQYAH
jgi:hypothetical protein